MILWPYDLQLLFLKTVSLEWELCRFAGSILLCSKNQDNTNEKYTLPIRAPDYICSHMSLTLSLKARWTLLHPGGLPGGLRGVYHIFQQFFIFFVFLIFDILIRVKIGRWSRWSRWTCKYFSGQRCSRAPTFSQRIPGGLRSPPTPPGPCELRIEWTHSRDARFQVEQVHPGGDKST